jgi:hypothetical protein
MPKMKYFFAVLIALFMFSTAQALIRIVPSKQRAPEEIVRSIVNANFDVAQYREVRVHTIFKNGKPDYLLVTLSSKTFHKFELVKVNLDQDWQVLSVQRNYMMRSQQNPLSLPVGFTPKCPDTSIEFIAMCPNDDSLEQNITKDVAQYAQSHGLKTVELLLTQATSENYLNYMACPNLKGNFYDGDSNPEEFVTYDGLISSSEIAKLLKGQFRFQVTNIWLACEAFNDPIKSSIIETAQTQKYAAGINDLLVGPSDNTAACAMKAGIDGNPMTASFKACYDQLDSPEDQWGFDGHGSDYFGK